MSKPKSSAPTWLALVLLAGLIAGACQPQPSSVALAKPDQVQAPVANETEQAAPEIDATSLPTRPPYSPGELVDYTVQAGDTLPALAAHFNTQVAEIRQANPIIPEDVTTLPPGMPMRIPIYYAPLWGSPYQILPDSLFVNGPAQVDFDVAAFVEDHPGWLKYYVVFASGANRDGAETVEQVAQNFSVSPRLLLALGKAKKVMS